MTFIFRNMTIFWDISKWNREKKKMKWRKYILAIVPRAFVNKIFKKLDQI